jgi:hypothetical protein
MGRGEEGKRGRGRISAKKFREGGEQRATAREEKVIGLGAKRR